MHVRRAKIEDLNKIVSIYNHAVRTTMATFDTGTKTTLERMDWFKQHDAKRPIIVVEEEEEVIGWACLSKWSDRLAYNGTVELSIYIEEQHQGKGAANLLMDYLMEHAKKRKDIHTVIGRVAGENHVSRYLHEKYDFVLLGIMKEVGFKFGQYIDVQLYQRLFDE